MCRSHTATQPLRKHNFILLGAFAVLVSGNACQKTPLILPAAPSAAEAGTLPDRNGVRSAVRDLKNAGDYHALNALAGTLRSEVIHLGTETPLITQFYISNGPNPTNHRNTDEDYERILTRIAEWRGQTPDDPTPRILEAYVWLQYATNIRRDDRIFGPTGRMFRERLENGRKIVEDLLPQHLSDAYLYNVGLGIAENLDDDDLSQRVFAEGRRNVPGHIQLYNLRANFLRNREAPGGMGWSKFLAAQADAAGGTEGDRLYALAHFRSLMLAEFSSVEGSKAIGNYERLKRGTYADIEAGSRWSEHASRLCAVAALRNNDRATARDFLLQTGPTAGGGYIHPDTLLAAWKKTGILDELDAIRRLETEGSVTEAETQLRSLIPAGRRNGWLESFALRHGLLDALREGVSPYPVQKPEPELSPEEARNMALVRLMAGDLAGAKSLARTVRRESPESVIPDVVEYGAAVMEQDTAASERMRNSIRGQQSGEWKRGPFPLAQSFLSEERAWSELSEEFELRNDQGYLALALMQLRAMEKGDADTAAEIREKGDALGRTSFCLQRVFLESLSYGTPARTLSRMAEKGAR